MYGNWGKEWFGDRPQPRRARREEEFAEVRVPRELIDLVADRVADRVEARLRKILEEAKR